jgi:hypothetical protein
MGYCGNTKLWNGPIYEIAHERTAEKSFQAHPKKNPEIMATRYDGHKELVLTHCVYDRG